MPLYEYRCAGCQHRVTILIREGAESSPCCPDCGSTDLKRIFSTFSVSKSDQSVYDDILSDRRLIHGLERNDPRALAEWNKKMSQGTDHKIGPEYEDMLGRMEAGEMPRPEKPEKGEDATEEQP